MLRTDAGRWWANGQDARDVRRGELYLELKRCGERHGFVRCECRQQRVLLRQQAHTLSQERGRAWQRQPPVATLGSSLDRAVLLQPHHPLHP